MKRMNKVLAVILAVVMVVEILPLGAGISTINAFAAEVLADGFCGIIDEDEGLDGSQIQYVVYSDGRMIISGSGEIAEDAFWSIESDGKKLQYDIRELSIGEGVTGLNYNQFRDYDTIISVNLPNSLIEIKDDAFFRCYSLRYVHFGNGLKSIMSSAFGDTAIEEIDLPESIENIAESAFYSCPIESIYIPKNVKSFTGHQFYGSFAPFGDIGSLKEIIVSEENPYYCSIDGVLYNKSVTELISYPLAKDDKRFAMPNTVETLGEDAFTGTHFEELVLSDNLISFSYTERYPSYGSYFSPLQSIEVNSNNNMTSMDGVLYSKDESTLICFPFGRNAEEFAIPSSVETIGCYAFKYNSANIIDIPNTVKYIRHDAFSSAQLTSLNVPDSVLEIDYRAFACPNLKKKNVTLGNGIQKLGSNLFHLETFYDRENLYINDYFVQATDSTYNIREGTKLLSEDTLGVILGGVEFVNIPASVKYINNPKAQRGYKTFDTVVYYAGTEEEWNSIIFGPGYDWISAWGYEVIYEQKYTGNVASGSNDIYSWTIDFEGLMTINAPTDENDNWTGSLGASVRELRINYDIPVDSLQDLVYSFDNLESYHAEGSSLYHAVNGVLYSNNGQSLIAYPSGKADLEYAVNPGTTEICAYAFRNANNLQEIVLPQGLLKIDTCAFQKTNSLERINIPQTVTNLGLNIFEDSKIDDVQDGRYLIIDGFFFGETGNVISSLPVVIPDGVHTIAPLSIYDVDVSPYYYRPIVIPISVTRIYPLNAVQGDFYYYGSELDWSGINLGIAPVGTVHYNYNGEAILINKGYCGDMASFEIYIDFASYTCSLSINGEGSLYEYQSSSGYPWWMFNISSITISEGITAVPEYAFENTSIDKVLMPSSIQSIGANAFLNGNIESFTIGPNLTAIGENNIGNISASLYVLNDDFDFTTYGQNLHVTGMTSHLSKEKYEDYLHIETLIMEIMYSEYLGYSVDVNNSIAEFNSLLGTSFTLDDFSAEGNFEEIESAIVVFLGCSFDEIMIEDEGSTFPWFTIYGHKGATSEAYAAQIGANFVCLHEYVDGVCKYCGEAETVECTHENTETRNAVAAACTEPGYTGDTYCIDCGEKVNDGEGIDALGHDWGEWTETTAATCTEAGEETRSCRRSSCDASETREIDALGHGYDLGFDEEDIASTCKVRGYYRKICLDCGDIVESRTYDLDPNNHVGGTEIRNAVEATCTAEGYTGDTYCKGCNNKIADGEIIDAHGHDYVVVVTAPTCTNGGYTTYICSRCPDSYVDDEVNALGHDWSDWAETTAATCIEAGEETRSCKRSGCDMTETRATDALGHDYAAVVTAPTCTNGGYTTYTCSRCPDSYVDDETDALGHDWSDWAETIAVTCTEAGEETRTCQRNGCDATETRATDALGHDYVPVVTAPTCTNGGNTTYTCSRCPDSYVNDETDALGHDFGEWVVIQEATYLHEGIKTRECSRCPVTDTELLEKLIPDETKIDEETGSQLAFQEDVVPADTQLVVDEEFDGIYFQLLNREKGNVRKQLFNITLESNGEKIQPNGYVLVRLPIPEGYNPTYLTVYYIASDGSGMQRLESYIDGGYICFETTHFSEYAIVDESPDQDDPGSSQSNCVCGQNHTGPLAGLIRFFHKIVYFFKNLFRKK